MKDNMRQSKENIYVLHGSHDESNPQTQEADPGDFIDQEGNHRELFLTSPIVPKGEYEAHH